MFVSSVRFLALLVAVLVLSPLQAQASSKIAVLDLQYLLSEAKAAQGIQDQVNKQRESFLKELEAQENALRDKEKSILEKAKDMSQEELEEQRVAFEKEFQEARAKAQSNKVKIERALGVAMEKLRGEMSSVVEGIAKEQGYDLVLPRQNVIVGGDDLDISKETLKRLNKKVAKIELELK